MKRLAPIIVAASVAAICCAVAATFCTYYYARYQAYAQLEERLKSLESQVQGLASTVRDRWATRKIWSEIVSAQKPSTGAFSFPLRLASNTNGVQRFQLRVEKEYGRSVAAWVSDWKPRAEMMKFDQFDVSPVGDSLDVEILARPKTGETIDMEFTVSVLIQRFERN